MKEPARIQNLLETLLYFVSPKYNLPKLMFAVTCKNKKVPKAVRYVLEMAGQVIPATTLRDTLSDLQHNGQFEQRVHDLLRNHGKVGQKLAVLRADNFQLGFNCTASASAKDPSKNSGSVVFTSAIKSGDVLVIARCRKC